MKMEAINVASSGPCMQAVCTAGRRSALVTAMHVQALCAF
jgi:hypothetical protein